jgi:hypothetical protein
MPLMSEQSQRDEMNAAIKAQRERHNVPRSIAGDPDPLPVAAPATEPEPQRPKSLLSRLLGK